LRAEATSANEEGRSISTGMWNNHHLRQAGKYAKRSYKLERGRPRRITGMRHVQVVTLSVAAVAPAGSSVPRRPDTR